MANETVNRYVNVYITSGEAQKALDRLLVKQKQLTDEIEKGPKNVDQLRAKLAQLEEPIDRAKRKLAGELTPSIRDSQTAVNNLGNRLKRMSTEDADFSRVVAQYQQANKELDQQRGKIGFLQRTLRTFWQEAKTVAVGVLVGNTIQSALQSVVGYVSGIVTGSAKIADELSDIEKTTGLTAEEVKKVNTELGKIDTRTSRSALRQLASEAGKLGADSVEDVLKFVDSADKIRVALGEDLGEEAILNIAKLSKIFQVEALNIASAINEIGASSEASEAFAVDFLKRVAGTAPTVKLAADQVLGYAAALEISGQTTEVSATALNTFFLDFVSNIEKFGQAAGFAKGELENILNVEGTNEAFLQFLERLKQSQPTAGGFISQLKALGIDGARGSNVMLALANNIGTVREQQLIASEAIKSNSSIMDEFNKKNNNAAAELDKLKKNFAGLFASETLMNAGAAAVRVLNNFVNVLRGIPQFVEENRFALLTLVAGIVLLNKSYIAAALATTRDSIAKVYNAVVTRAIAVATRLAVTAQAAYITVTNALTGRITLATAAQRLWNVAMSLGAGPLGVILVAAGALVIAIGNLLGRTRQLTAEQKIQAEVASRVSSATAETVEQMKLLATTAADNNVSLDNRKKALEALIKINPEYLKGLTLENIATAEGTKILNDYIKQLQAKAEAQAKNELFNENIRKRAEQLNKIRSTRPELTGLSDEQLIDELNKTLEKVKGAAPLETISIGGVKIKDLIETSKNIQILRGQLQDLAKQDIAKVIDSNTVLTQKNDTVGESIDNLREKLKQLQEERDATTDASLRSNLTQQIEAVEKRINELLGKTDKAVKKSKNDLDDLLKELQKIREGITLSSLSPLDKELAELDLKYQHLRERAGRNARLLNIIAALHAEEKLILIRDFARREVEEWDKAGDEINKKADEAFRKNIDSLKLLAARIEAEINKNAEVAIRSRDADRLASRELQVLRARGKSRLDAELELLKEQERQELQQKDITENQKLLIEEKYRQKRMQAELQYWVGVIRIGIDFLQQIASIDQIFSEGKAQRENADLERDRRINDKKKTNLEKRLKAGTISQQQYDREVQRIEREQEKREREIARRQFERDKRQKFVNALVNSAGAVLTTLERFGPPIPPNFLGIAAMALTVATGAAQLIAISKTKPPEFGKGGKLEGPSHQDKSKGMPVTDPYTGKVHAYLEGGEGIANKHTMADNRSYTVTGTPSQIISRLNAKGGGVQWAPGAQLVPAWQKTKQPSMNFPEIKKFYALGGQFGKSAATDPQAASESSGDVLAVIRDLVTTNQGLNGTIANMQTTIASLQGTLAAGISAYTLLSDNERQKERRDRIVEEATLK